MKLRVILCRSCGQKNQVPLEAWRADCGRCETRLQIPGATEKMLRARAPALVSVAVVLLVAGLTVSGVAEMWSGPERASADETSERLGDGLDAS